MTDTTKPDKKIMTIEYNGITYRFSRSAFEGTKASPIYAAVSLPDGRELIYSMWNQGKLGFRYLRRNGCSTCALTCVLSTLVDPAITPQSNIVGQTYIITYGRVNARTSIEVISKDKSTTGHYYIDFEVRPLTNTSLKVRSRLSIHPMFPFVETPVQKLAESEREDFKSSMSAFSL